MNNAHPLRYIRRKIRHKTKEAPDHSIKSNLELSFQDNLFQPQPFDYRMKQNLRPGVSQPKVYEHLVASGVEFLAVDYQPPTAE